MSSMFMETIEKLQGLCFSFFVDWRRYEFHFVSLRSFRFQSHNGSAKPFILLYARKHSHDWFNKLNCRPLAEISILMSKWWPRVWTDFWCLKNGWPDDSPLSHGFLLEVFFTTSMFGCRETLAVLYFFLQIKRRLIWSGKFQEAVGELLEFSIPIVNRLSKHMERKKRVRRLDKHMHFLWY